MGSREGWRRAGGRARAAMSVGLRKKKRANHQPTLSPTLSPPSASNPATVSYSPTTDTAYVGHASPAGSAAEGGAFDAAGARVSTAAPPHGGGSSLFVGLGGADAVAPGGGAGAAWSGDAATVGATQAKEAAVGAATTTPTTTKTDAAVDSTTLAQATTTPTTSFPTAGQHAATTRGGVSTAGGETMYLRADRAVAAAAPAALDSLPKPPAPRGPAGALAATALAAVGGAAATVSASAGAAVPQDAPPADDAEAFSMAVRDVAAGVAGRLGAAPRRAGPGV